MSFYIKQYGLQRSGTNILKAILEVNFKNAVVLSNYLGDKHDVAGWDVMAKNLKDQDPKSFGLNRFDKWKIKRLVSLNKIPVVINIKEPVSWVNSFYKYQRKKVLYKNPDAQFPFEVQFARKVLESYEERLVSWGDFYKNNSGCLIFKHEQLVAGLKDTDLFLIRDRFGLKPSKNFPVGRLTGYARRGIDSQRGAQLINEKMDFDRRYHLDGLWREDVPDEVMRFLEVEKQRMLERLPTHTAKLIE